MSLVVQNLKKSYGKKTVVNELSFTMEQPGVYALLGTNGAGKSTSIRMILGMLLKDEGEVLFNGAPLTTSTVNVGYLAEERGLYPKVSLKEQILYFASLKGVSKKEAEKRMEHWAKKLKLTEYFYPVPVGKKKVKPYKADQLSKGNQQKVQLMATLISDPELIVLDEPLSGLDPVNTDLFKEIIHELAGMNKYIIMSSHQMETIEEFCTDLTILHRGNPVLQGNLAEIKKSYGRINLCIKAEGDVHPFIEEMGIAITKETPEEIFVRLSEESQAQELLGKIVAANIPVIKFMADEPTLHEIFVEKVGEEANEV